MPKKKVQPKPKKTNALQNGKILGMVDQTAVIKKKLGIK